jgi:hypothetical protein
MGPIPADLDLAPLIGRQLNQICIGPFDLQFRFDSDRSIACQGRVIVEVDGSSEQVFDGSAWGDVSLLPRIAGREVASWKIEATHEFSISLTGGAKLRFQSTDCPYEEFVIHPEIWVI